MFTIKPLTRKNSVQFTVTFLGTKVDPIVERANFIKGRLSEGKNYTQAIRAFDTKVRQDARKNR